MTPQTIFRQAIKTIKTKEKIKFQAVLVTNIDDYIVNRGIDWTGERFN